MSYSPCPSNPEKVAAWAELWRRKYQPRWTVIGGRYTTYSAAGVPALPIEPSPAGDVRMAQLRDEARRRKV